MDTGGEGGKIIVQLLVVIRLIKLGNKGEQAGKRGAGDFVRAGGKPVIQRVKAGDIKLNLRDAVKVGVGGIDLIAVKSAKLLYIVKYRVDARERFEKLGKLKQVFYRLLTVFYNLNIRGEKVGKRAAFHSKNFVKSKLVADRLGHIRAIIRIFMLCSLFHSGIKKAEV